MNNLSDELVVHGDDAIEALLEKAAPRPLPPGNDEMAVRTAVHAEWRAVTRRVKTRRYVKHFAIAATVLLGIAVSFNALQVRNAPGVQVATISKSYGSIYLLGEQSEQQEMADLVTISAGQVILTGKDAGIGIDWGNGGSLRIDKNTRIEFTSPDSVFLQSGRIYFDSQVTGLTAAITGSEFVIETEHGSVEHLGTQYMTAVNARDLTISVREGQVEVDGVYINRAVAVAGQQLRISGGARPILVDFNVHGEAWRWIEATSPVINADGHTVAEFLTAIGREIGLEVHYESPAAEEMAQDGVLKGNIDIGPREELALRMSGEDLAYRIDGGAIYVSVDTGSRP
ncbi:MAG: FecR family protein [Gammaproteobacteria bacterium]|nr:FecR family protein [Gammaproteobacteria bacterium]MDH3414872.1 FecR family protein [Gammaproteobacteria bacterium]